MDTEGCSSGFIGLAKISCNDQHFLLNFIMSIYLGPDVYSDNPRCSVLQRLTDGLPPYTSNNLGSSSLSISQLKSLYCYVLRNANPDLVLKPDMLYMYIKGCLSFPSSEPLQDNWQFTNFFPLSLHQHKKYSASNEIVKGIVFISDPVTSYLKKEDIEKFVYLSRTDDLKINDKNCLSYYHGIGYSEDRQETKPNGLTHNSEQIAGSCLAANERSAIMFRESYKRQCFCDAQSVPSSPNDMSTQQNGDITVMLNIPDFVSNQYATLTGTARGGIAGLPIGTVDIGISEAAYFFQIALPGVQRDFCHFSCEIEPEGKVRIEGSTTGGRVLRKRSRVFHMRVQQLCLTGPFTLTFNLPGPVDPRLFSPNFRSDGIFEGVIIKEKHKNR